MAVSEQSGKVRTADGQLVYVSKAGFLRTTHNVALIKRDGCACRRGYWCGDADHLAFE